MTVEPLNADPAYSYTFTWISEADACEQCKKLNGTYEGQSLYQHALIHPVYGEIWNLDTDLPLTHGHTGINCRCHLIVHVKIDYTKLNMGKLLETSKEFNKGERNFGNFFKFDMGRPSTSIGEITQLSSVTEVKQELEGVKKQLDEINEKSAKGELTLRQEVRTLSLMMSIVERSFGDPNIDAATAKLRNLLMMAMRARMAILAVQAAMIPGAGFLTALYAGANVGFLGISAYDMITYDAQRGT
ncbi:MAG: hypothetical protein WC325_12025 [Candidatus Bathyarchaeia archaeon]|jgi:hypothetical protein